MADDVWKVDSLVEKPALEDAPSNLAVFGRYLLSPRVMELLADVQPGVGGEIQLTDALDAVLAARASWRLGRGCPGLASATVATASTGRYR